MAFALSNANPSHGVCEMRKDIRNDKELLDHLISVISSPRFLKIEGIGNEVPFFICPYKITKHIAMATVISQLISQLSRSGITVLHVNLYDKVLEILKNRGLLNKIITEESKLSKDQLKELLQNTVDIEQYLVPEIKKEIDANCYDVLFLSGIGEVFPYIRSHNVLNNLQSKAKDQPTVMFFPGEYTFSEEKGAVLKLFDCLPDDNYYRAFNILHYEL